VLRCRLRRRSSPSPGQIAQHLVHVAAAVPAVRRQIIVTERIGRRPRDIVECGVFGAYPLITGGAVLEIVTVAVGHEIMPFDSHLQNVDCMVVFGIKTVGVVPAADGLDIAPEHLERSVQRLIEQAVMVGFFFLSVSGRRLLVCGNRLWRFLFEETSPLFEGGSDAHRHAENLAEHVPIGCHVLFGDSLRGAFEKQSEIV